MPMVYDKYLQAIAYLTFQGWNTMCAQTLYYRNSYFLFLLTHWGLVTHICVGKLSIIGSNNGLSPSRRQAIIWINAGILLIGTLGTNFSEISIEI